MEDIVANVVEHIRGDTAATVGVVALLGGAERINRDYLVKGLTPELPQLYVVQTGGFGVSTGLEVSRVSIWVEAADQAKCARVHARLRKLFHEKTNYTLGGGALTGPCNASKRTGPVEYDRDGSNAPFEGQAFYEFTVTADHGF